MLINKTEGVIKIQYNGKVIAVEAGGKLDVRDYDVTNKDVRNVEKHLMNKNPGVLELTEDKNDNVVSKEAKAEIKELKKANAEKDIKIAELQKAYENINEKHSASVGEIEGAKQETATMKSEFDRISKVNAELEEEVEKLRLQVSAPKGNKK